MSRSAFRRVFSRGAKPAEATVGIRSTLDEALSTLTVLQFSAIPAGDTMRYILPLLLQAVAHSEGFGEVPTTQAESLHSVALQDANKDLLCNRPLRLSPQRQTEKVLYGVPHKVASPTTAVAMDAWVQLAAAPPSVSSSHFIASPTGATLEERHQEKKEDTVHPIHAQGMQQQQQPSSAAGDSAINNLDLAALATLKLPNEEDQARKQRTLPSTDGMNETLRLMTPAQLDTASSTGLTSHTTQHESETAKGNRMATSLQSNEHTAQWDPHRTVRWFEHSLQQGMHWRHQDVHRLASQLSTVNGGMSLPIGIQRLLRAEFGYRGPLRREAPKHQTTPSSFVRRPTAAAAEVSSSPLRGSRLQRQNEKSPAKRK